MVQVFYIPLQEQLRFRMLHRDCLGEIDEHGVSIWDQDVVFAWISMNQLHLIVKVLQHFKGLLVPASRRFEGYLAEMRGRFSFPSNELQEDDVLLYIYRCGHCYGLTSYLQVLVLF